MDQLPSSLLPQARTLARKRGVIAVFYGIPSRGGSWVDQERGLCLHVEKKLRGPELGHHRRVPALVDGLPTDVFECGALSALVLEVGDRARAPGRGSDRHSTLTAVGSEGARAYTLTSGHATLPLRPDGTLFRRWYDNGGPEGQLVIEDGLDTHTGRLLMGAVGDEADWGLAAFDGVVCSPYHPVGGTSPFPAVFQVPIGEEVSHWSRLASGRREGRIVGLQATPARVALPDGSSGSLVNSWCVASTGAPFSQPGDSGSLVFNRAGQAVGVVAAGTAWGDLTYVLPLAPLRGALGARFSLFFRGVS